MHFFVIASTGLGYQRQRRSQKAWKSDSESNDGWGIYNLLDKYLTF